ncbi:MAG TPA: phosphonate metabolism transcriptional regulator PhnF [Clostridiales bacterium]|nr:phosphonate metabolism transcriptional regulator PhnF [Clostridiales bacterium]
MVEKRIEHYSYIPKYHQLFSILRTKIEDGDWEPNQPIPSERELEKTYKISRTTIRQALSMLDDYGYIYRDIGRGTFVAPPKLQNSLHELTSFSKDMEERGLKPGHEILNLDYVEPTAVVRQQLELPDDFGKVLYIERLRFADDIPIGLHYAYLPLRENEPITISEMNQYGSLYDLLQSKFNLIPAEAYETLEATIADAKEAKLLDVNKGSPLLLIERTVWSKDRKTMEFVRILYRGDRYKYFVHLARRESA